MFSYLLSAVTGVPADLNFSNVNTNNKSNLKKKNTKVRKNKKKKGPKPNGKILVYVALIFLDVFLFYPTFLGLKFDVDDDSAEKSVVSEDENSDDDESYNYEVETSIEPQSIVADSSELRNRIAGELLLMCVHAT